MRRYISTSGRQKKKTLHAYLEYTDIAREEARDHPNIIKNIIAHCLPAQQLLWPASPSARRNRPIAPGVYYPPSRAASNTRHTSFHFAGPVLRHRVSSRGDIAGHWLQLAIARDVSFARSATRPGKGMPQSQLLRRLFPPMYRLSGCLLMMIPSMLSLLVDYHLFACLTPTLGLLLVYFLSSVSSA